MGTKTSGAGEEPVLQCHSIMEIGCISDIYTRFGNGGTKLVLLNCVGMDDGWILGRYTMDTGEILRRIIHGISMLYLYVAQAPRISIHNPQVIYTICA